MAKPKSDEYWEQIYFLAEQEDFKKSIWK